MFKKAGRLTFRKGVHPPSRKNTRGMETQKLPMPDKIFVPLSQHIGAPCEAAVSVGDKVLCGTLVGRATSLVSSNIFSSVSGKVIGTELRRNQLGSLVEHLIIQNDRQYKKYYMPPLAEETPAAILSRLSDAGVVGMGGAAFPTHVKISPDVKIDTVIINGAECEPYITCDFRILMEQAEKVLGGAVLLKKALQAERAVIAIEDNKPEALEKLLGLAGGYEGVTVVPVRTKYPQGAEKQLIYAVTKRKVPAGGLPKDVGCVVNNVATAFACFRAVRKGEPLNERIITVDGGAIEKSGNYLVGTGVPIEYIYGFCRGQKEENLLAKTLAGGPMMGSALADLTASVTKATSSLLFLTEEEINVQETTACINCAKCAMACPMNIMPMCVDTAVESGNTANAEKYGAMHCIECGCCAYVCPAKRPLVQSCRLAKQMLREKGGRK